MATINLIEYAWSDVSRDYILSATFTFDPNPRSVKKTVKMMWRARHVGTNRFKKSKFKNRETTDFTLQGSMAETKRREIEYYSKKNSRFKIINLNMLCPNPTVTPYNSSNLEDVYVVIENVDFTDEEGKPNFFTYTLNLTRVRAPGS